VLNTPYDVLAKLGTGADRKRICTAVSFSTSIMVPEQSGHVPTPVADDDDGDGSGGV